MSNRDQPARREGSVPAHQPERAADLPFEVPGSTTLGPRCGSTTTVDPAGPGTRTGPVRSDAAEATWENEGGRLLRAIRLDQYAAAPGAEPEADTHPALRATTRAACVNGTR